MGQVPSSMWGQKAKRQARHSLAEDLQTVQGMEEEELSIPWLALSILLDIAIAVTLNSLQMKREFRRQGGIYPPLSDTGKNQITTFLS